MHMPKQPPPTSFSISVHKHFKLAHDTVQYLCPARILIKRRDCTSRGGAPAPLVVVWIGFLCQQSDHFCRADAPVPSG